MKNILSIAISCIVLSACQTTPTYPPIADTLPELKVSFADPLWNGEKIPASQVCSLYGGEASTPKLRVSNVPDGANALIVEFNDRSYAPLSYDGGHGKIGFWLEGARNPAILKSVPAESQTLPNPAFIEANSRGRGRYAKPGYLPPCSGGKGNAYFAKIKAVYKAKDKSEQNKLLATGQIELGRY